METLSARFALFALGLLLTNAVQGFPVSQHRFGSLEGQLVYLFHIESQGWSCDNPQGVFEKCPERDMSGSSWRTDMVMRRVQHQGETFWTLRLIGHNRSVCYSLTDDRVDTCAINPSYPLGVRVDQKWSSLFKLHGTPDFFNLRPATKDGRYLCSSPQLQSWDIYQCKRPNAWALQYPSEEQWANCKTFEGTGNHQVKTCDRLLGEHFELRVWSTSQDALGYGLRIEDEPGHFINEWGFMKPVSGSNFFEPPFLSMHGVNITLNFANNQGANVTVHASCEPTLTACKAIKGIEHMCDASCSSQTPHPTQDYLQAPGVLVSMPEGYDRALFLATLNARNCVAATAELLGVEPQTRLSIAYVASKAPTALTGCSVGGFQGKAFCTIESKFSNTSLKKNAQLSAQVDAMLELASAGQCMGYYDTPTYTVAHELVHLFGDRVFPGLNHVLGEGLATFVEQNIQTKTQLSGLSNANTISVLCSANGYAYSNKPNDVQPYQTYDPGQHAQGLCLLETLRSKYGNTKFRRMFEVASRKPECIKPGQFSADYQLYGGFLNTLFQDDVLKHVGGPLKMTDRLVSNRCRD